MANLNQRIDKIEKSLPASAFLPDKVRGLVYRIEKDGPRRYFILEDGALREVVTGSEIEIFQKAMIEAAQTGNLGITVSD